MEEVVPIQQVNTVELNQNIKKPKKKNKVISILISIFSVLLIITTIIATLGFFFVYVPGKDLYSKILSAKTDVTDLKQTISDKDLDQAKIKIADLKVKIAAITSSYNKFSYAKSLPIAKNYYSDGLNVIKIANEGIETGEILIKAVEPYKDFLGLKGAATDSAKTTEDRIAFLTQSVEGLVPYMDTIEQKIAGIEDSLNQIDASRYPDEINGTQIKSNILKAKETVAEVHKLVKDGKPILTKTSWLLGKDAPRKYLMIFQNNAELRPTGGFWTAYGIIQISNGKVTPLASSDIYSLDELYNSKAPAPRAIKAYHINVPYANIRDMNISPDFPTSAQLFLDAYKKATGSKDKIDAVVGLDLDVLVDMVKVLGRIGVSGFGNFSADPDKRCDGCAQIIYQLEYIADKPKSYIDTDRKGFLGPLMNSLLSNAMGSEKSKIAPLAQAMLKDVNQKHVLFYFTDTEIQSAAESANIAGKITQTDANTDYLHLNDANFASAKSNLFITQKIKHEIISDNGKVNHKVTVTYTNPSKASNCNLEKGDLCLNAAKYRDWFRFFVPKGSTLTKMTGSEVEPVLYEELGKQVFEGFYGDKYPLYAESSLKTSVQYTSSVPASSNYTLLLQKQPGTKAIEYQLVVNGKAQETFSWVADKTIKLDL